MTGFRHTAETKMRIAELWREGWAASAIAGEITKSTGFGMSRSAVMGALKRMGLCRSDRSPNVAAPRPGPAKGFRPAKRKVAAASVTAILDASPDLQALPESERSASPCLWPYDGDTICGRARDRGDWRSSYCPAHRAAAVRPGPGGKRVMAVRPAPDPKGAPVAGRYRYQGDRL